MSIGTHTEEEIFNTARLIQAPEARAFYIQHVCGGEQALRSRIEALLRIHDEDPGFLQGPPPPLAKPAPKPSLSGPEMQIGQYQLIEQIGEGGFGIVFMAEQQHPVRRTVALKVLKPGMDTRQVVARFEAERQALALMDHPNIARVLDGGETASGRPYFVMDLVRGIPITRYCDEQRLTPRERLALFLPVCQAVQHAHQKGIIHRDLKPGNVLISAYDPGAPAVPKVIDFGVAKATGRQLTDRTLATGFGSIVGTLEYMSPEQAGFNARDIDTRTDIYSLGVLLYELLTGTTPLTREQLEQEDLSEVLRLIREGDPPRPSTRLGETKDSMAALSAQRRLDPARLTKEVRGELDWIVMKCLEKDRSRRYATVNGLARDIERYLNQETVEACPPSTGYKLRKFARKNRKLLGAAAAFAFLLTAGTALSLWQAVRAIRAEQVASQERDRARRHLYVAHMNLGQTAWEEARVGRLLELLEQHRPSFGHEDLRGFEWHYLQRLTDSALWSSKGHGERVWYVAFSPDGSRLASAGDDQTLRVWDAGNGREILALKGHTAPVVGVVFSPDGKHLASGSKDRTVKIWDAGNGRELLTLKEHSNWVTRVAYSPNGNILASSSDDQTLRLWDAATGRAMLVLKGHKGGIVDLAFSPDGKRLASASHDRTLQVWDVASGRGIMTLQGHADSVTGVAYSPDGKLLASSSADRTVKLWGTADGSELLTWKRHTERIFGLAFSPDGKMLASAGVDQAVRVWDLAGERELTLKGHTSWISSVAFSPDGNRLASAGDDRTIRVWAVPTAAETMMVITDHGRPSSVAFSPDGNRLASAGRDQVVRVWDAASGREAMTLRGSTDSIDSVAFSPDGDRLASAGQDKTVRVWDVPSGRELLTLPATAGRVLSVVFSPDGKCLASGNVDKTVRVWRVSSGTEVLTIRGHTGPVHSVAFSPDGKRLASGSADKTVKVWDAHSGREISTSRGHTDWVSSAAFSPDGRWLASASGDKSVKVWDAATGQEVLTLEGHTMWVPSVAFSPDGNRLASAGADQMVKIWDLASGQETLTLKGHSALVSSLAFSPDGMRLVSAGYDRTLRIWDARPWSPQQRIEQEARNLIGQLYRDAWSKMEVVRQIEQDVSLPAEVRHEALHMAGRWREDLFTLNAISWRVVARGNETRDAYALALRQAEAACRLDASNGSYLSTLGAALYRNDKLAESVETLTRADKIHSASKEGRRPGDVAILAMAHFKLGQKEKAQALLADLRQIVKQPAWAEYNEAQRFQREAEALLEGERRGRRE